MNKKSLLTTAILAVVIGAIGFFGGMQYQKGKGQNTNSGMNKNGIQMPVGSGAPNGSQRGQQGGSEPISGEITNKEDDSITVKMQDGSSKIIILSSSTTINKTSEGSSSDLDEGVTITVMGTTNTDGSVTAQTVSIGTNFPGEMSGDQPK